MTSWLQYRLGIAGNRSPWHVMWMRWIVIPAGRRTICLAGRHSSWARETMLLALSSGRSRRCRLCNRLVLKKEYR